MLTLHGILWNFPRGSRLQEVKNKGKSPFPKSTVVPNVVAVAYGRGLLQIRSITKF